MVFRPVLAALALVAVALQPTPAARAAGDTPPLLVELFTSQGCSSCRPADAYMEELARRDDLVALSMHVNYWDYIGWKDPFASNATTDRQRAYGRRLDRGQVYTPQIVIDGRDGVVGSNRRAVERAIDDARAAQRLRLRLRIDARLAPDGGLVVVVPAAPSFKGAADVWLARFDAERVTPVPRGENAGYVIRNVNVVRSLAHIGMWSGKPLEIDLPPDVLMAGEGGRDGCVVIVQIAGLGPVLGVRELALPGDS